VIANLVRVQAASTGPIEIAVGYQCAVERQAELAAVRVPGHDQRVAERVPVVEHAQVGGVSDTDCEVCGRVGRLVVEHVVLEWWIEYAHERPHAYREVDMAVAIAQIGQASLTKS